MRAVDKPHIKPEYPRKLKASVDVDAAYVPIDPHGNRWDFGIAFRHTNRDAEVIHWVETLTAGDSQVGKVIKKAQWLLKWFENEERLLKGFEKSILWVSSGATVFTLSSPLKKQMAQAGLQTVVGTLRIQNKRP